MMDTRVRRLINTELRIYNRLRVLVKWLLLKGPVGPRELIAIAYVIFVIQKLKV
jgi:hypothetical protein